MINVDRGTCARMRNAQHGPVLQLPTAIVARRLHVQAHQGMAWSYSAPMPAAQPITTGSCSEAHHPAHYVPENVAQLPHSLCIIGEVLVQEQVPFAAIDNQQIRPRLIPNAWAKLAARKLVMLDNHQHASVACNLTSAAAPWSALLCKQPD